MEESRETFSGGGADGRRPTMRDVASVAGVSLSTVSRVINADASVAADLVTRVHDAVALLGYRRDVMATNLRRADRQSASIGLIFEDVSNPFHAAVLRGAETVARSRGVLAFVGSSDEDPERERELTQAFASRRVDGLLIVPSGADQSYLLRERESGVALVFVDRPPRFIDADRVLSDNAGGAMTATEHLLAAGHRRIAYLGDRLRIHTAAERLRGYRETLDRHAVAYDEALVRVDLHHAAAVDAAVAELLAVDDPPTALLTGQNLITIGTVRKLRALGRQHDVALVGFDDVVLADALEPGLTVVAQDPVGLGTAAAELLFARLDGDRGPSREVVLPTRLIERGSGELTGLVAR